MKETDVWKPAAGYQCKLGLELPNSEKHRAWKETPLWFGLEGPVELFQKCVEHTEDLGWKVLGNNTQFDLLGVSILEALPRGAAAVNAPLCESYKAVNSLFLM